MNGFHIRRFPLGARKAQTQTGVNFRLPCEHCKSEVCGQDHMRVMLEGSTYGGRRGSLATVAWSSHIPTPPSGARSGSTATEPKGNVAARAAKASSVIVKIAKSLIARQTGNRRKTVHGTQKPYGGRWQESCLSTSPRLAHVRFCGLGACQRGLMGGRTRFFLIAPDGKSAKQKCRAGLVSSRSP
jgi:hypothetical protein